MLIATLRTGLTGMPGVYLDDSDTSFLGFIGDEVIQLSECPTVQAPFVLNMLLLFASSHLGGVSNVREVFQHDGRARSSVLYDTLGKDMITVAVESLLFLTQLLEMFLGRLTSFRLKVSLETKITVVNLFPVPITEELPLAGDSRPIQPQVNPDHLVAVRDNWLRNIDHDMQPPCTLAETQISCTDLPPIILGTVSRNSKGNTLFACTGRETNLLLLPVQGIGLLIVANGTRLASRTVYGLELGGCLAAFEGFRNLLGIACLMPGFPGQGTLEGFSGFDPRLNEQVRNQSRTSRFCLTVRRMMQAYAVLFGMLPAICTDYIECFGKLAKRLLQGYCLLWRGLQLYLDRSIHT